MVTVRTQPSGSVWQFENEWSLGNGICGCCNDLGTCCYAYWCTPCFLCKLHSRTNECLCTWCLLGGNTALRTKVRTGFRIEGSICARVHLLKISCHLTKKDDRSGTEISAGLWLPERLVGKAGRIECFIQHRPFVWSRTCADWYSNLISAKWLSVLTLVVGVFLFSWLLFAIIWYLLAFYHGDFQEKASLQNNHRPCLVNTGNSFLAFFLFSLETQHTIGYGYRHINDECKASVILLMIQSCVGVLITIYVGGIVFNKLARPKQSMRVLSFSERAVIAPRDGQLCFMFKIGNNVVTQLTRPAIRVIYCKLQKTPLGDTTSMENYDMAILPSNTNIMFICPIVIEHRIDKKSPLYPITPTRLYNSESDLFEIVVIVEGTMESTGDACQYRTSYKSREILWGFRFKQTNYTIENNRLKFNMSSFEEFEPVVMDKYICKGPKLYAPELSAKRVYQRRRTGRRGLRANRIQEKDAPAIVNA
ncbi:unnamed protein product [Didymodactylos carnosus]|uniref:Uncharacterized protein n=1 Tax=Didymodactylos carnosus TaxID=1234261 RepID=A0A813QDR7_9BILA|nr:unnamed protein product [Didymodactylos carnosus]CAF1151133.1 unnamed protein product [Didymodactylos carnosus]CAF3547764.1 unnamed protein product [Didymodactylos carnosus]CAF3958228.1 unnamed protein product [Didymodactylos carnosus]